MTVVKRFIREEDGIGVVELILILVVLIGLVIIFRDQLTSLINSIFDRIVSDSSSV
ncbi:MAG: Flp1 family type IVb pilin [bacterium]|nr:Flp1 family type IVb pilin [bacterium]